MSKTVRTTISIPAELKARMDAEGEDINWSSVATQAFESKLSEIVAKRGARTMYEVIGDTVRERLVRNGIKEIEWRYAKYVAEMGKEGVVFIFNLLDPFGRDFAEHHAGVEEVARQLEQYDPAEVTPAFFFVCGLESASKMLGTGEFEMKGDHPGIPVPVGKFLAVGVSHKGMLLRWLPKPEPRAIA